MRAGRHLWRLLGEVWTFARTHKVWWLVPLFVILLLITVFIVAFSAASPFIYPLF